MSTALVSTATHLQPPGRSLPQVPWRDPHTVSPTDLAEYISRLEHACIANPGSADLRTCLGVAYAVSYDVEKSMEALEQATAIAPLHFWAQLKYAELQYRLRAVWKAEAETLKAVDLAENAWQLSLARKQLQEIRSLKPDSARNATCNRPLTIPALVLSTVMLAVFLAMMWP